MTVTSPALAGGRGRAGVDELMPFEAKAHGDVSELVAYRRLLVRELTELAIRTEQAITALVKRLLSQKTSRIKAELRLVEKAIGDAIANSKSLAQRERLPRSALGVGPVLAASLIARMPELGRVSSRKIASLAGVAPFKRKSGKTEKPAHCFGGRPDIRATLYMAALAIPRRKDHPFAAFARGLTARGKPAKLVITAVMRKLIVALNAMAAHNTPWRANEAVG